MPPAPLSEFNPDKLLDVTNKLMQNPSEAEIRTVLNRCYYACYLTVKKRKRKLEAKDHISHKTIYRELQTNQNSALKTHFYSLTRYRVAADYGLHSYQDGVISTSIRGNNFPVELNVEQTGHNAIYTAKQFIKLF